MHRNSGYAFSCHVPRILQIFEDPEEFLERASTESPDIKLNLATRFKELKLERCAGGKHTFARCSIASLGVRYSLDVDLTAFGCTSLTTTSSTDRTSSRGGPQDISSSKAGSNRRSWRASFNRILSSAILKNVRTDFNVPACNTRHFDTSILWRLSPVVVKHRVLVSHKSPMDDDIRLNNQLKSLGKKLFQFRDLVAKIDIPESLPPPPHDKLFWDTFVKKCSAAVTVLRQVQAALTPDMYHLSLHPGEKIWRNPAAIPDLLGMGERIEILVENPMAQSRDEVRQWNAQLEAANSALDSLLDSQRSSFLNREKTSRTTGTNSGVPESDTIRIASLFSTTSRERAQPSQVT